MRHGPDELDEAVIVALGGNLAGDHDSPKALLETALERFGEHGLAVKVRSGWWRSLAWPDPLEPSFLNGVAIVQTDLTPAGVLRALRDIEDGFGRQRQRLNAPRTLDLDLIAYGRVVLRNDHLTLPHPRAAERLFVMGPLTEIAPDWTHPVLGRTAADLAGAASVGRDAQPA